MHINAKVKIMTEKEKQQKGMLYQANDPEVLKDLYYCENECFEINQIPPSRREERMERLRKCLVRLERECLLLPRSSVTMVITLKSVRISLPILIV